MESRIVLRFLDARRIRQRFLSQLLTGIIVVWPILSVLLITIVVLGLTVGLIEHWSPPESIYFAFVSGLTIGYGDFAPKSGAGRALSVAIGLCGVLTTALLAAVAVKALPSTPHADQ